MVMSPVVSPLIKAATTDQLRFEPRLQSLEAIKTFERAPAAAAPARR